MWNMTLWIRGDFSFYYARIVFQPFRLKLLWFCFGIRAVLYTDLNVKPLCREQNTSKHKQRRADTQFKCFCMSSPLINTSIQLHWNCPFEFNLSLFIQSTSMWIKMSVKVNFIAMNLSLCGSQHCCQKAWISTFRAGRVSEADCTDGGYYLYWKNLRLFCDVSVCL